MRFKRILALTLAIGLVLITFASCKNKDGKTVQKGTFSDGEKEFQSVDFGGTDFTILSVAPGTEGGLGYYNGDYIDVEGYTGTKTDNAVYDRNIKVEEAYNVTVETSYFSSENEIVPELQKYVQAGDVFFDLVYGWGQRLASLIPDNYFADFYAFDQAGYIDLEQEYWCPSVMDDLTIAGKMYVTTNDISMNKLAHGGFLFFNKQILEDYNLTAPYDYVDSNNWTIDTFFEMVQSVHQELDGNNKFDVYDRYGLLDIGTNGALFDASGYFYTTKTETGYTINLGQEKYINMISKIKKVLQNTEYVQDFDAAMLDNDNSTDEWNYARHWFVDGHALFTGGSANLTSMLRDMEDPYGVVPMPKADSSQEKYYATIDPNACMFAIPSTIRDAQKTGYILEYMAYKSNELLLPAYYEETIKTQRMSDERDQDMLDLIRGCVRYEWSDLALITKYAEDNRFKGNPLGFLFSQMYDGSASSYDRYKSAITKIVDDYYASVSKLEPTVLS